MLKLQRVATKGIILNNNLEILVLKRSSKDDFASGEFDLPGGKIEIGEDIIEGLLREIKEETGIKNILKEKIFPLKVWNFNKEEYQVIGITFIIFYNGNEKIKLSEEHEEYKWVNKNNYLNNGLPKWLEKEINLGFNFKKQLCMQNYQ